MDPAPVERAFEAERVTRELSVDMSSGVASDSFKCLDVGVVDVEAGY